MYIWDAIKKNDLAKLEAKLNEEYPIDHPITDTGLTALAYACSWTTNEAIINFLLQKGANAEKADLTGKCPIHHASLAGNV